jgi:methyl-accepting chemotaxis protein
MNAFANLPLGRKLIAVALVPLVALLVFLGKAVMHDVSLMNDAAAVRDVAARAPAIGAAAHELQRERGNSSGFIGARGQRFQRELGEQRARTDAAVADFRSALAAILAGPSATAMAPALRAADAAIGEAVALRGRVDRLDIPAPDAVAAYTRAVDGLIRAVEAIDRLTDDGAILSAARAYAAVLDAKERAGLERATGTNGFAAGRFTQPIYQTLMGLEALQRAYLAEASLSGGAALKRRLDEIQASPATAELERMRRIAAAMPFGGDAQGVDGAAWFAATTARIDLLKGAEDLAAELLGAIAAERAGAARSALMVELALGAVLLALSILTTVLVGRSIRNPIVGLVGEMRRLADGDTSVTLAGADRKDEIGDMTRAVVVFRDNAIARARLEAQARAEEQARLARAARVETLVGDFDAAVRALLGRVDANAGELETTARGLAGIAEGANARADAAAAAAEEASANVQTVAAASEELTASIGEIAARVAQANDVVSRASGDAESANARVAKLAEAAGRIGAVVGLIRDIADQTNLLALNATIEAARAGEAGRGFAVVASEVKSLASQTAKATEEISAHIAGIQGETTTAVAAIGAIARTMGEIEQYTTAIAAAIEEQGSATGEIARNVQEAASGTSAVSANMSGVTSASRDTSGSAGRVLDAAGDLATRAAELRGAVQRFLTEVRAA